VTSGSRSEVQLLTTPVTGGDGLERRLGLDSAAALVVGEVIGVGIFLTPAEMARGLRSPGLLFLVWLVVAATCFCGALCYGELAARFPAAGGGYVYLREAWGPAAAFLYGWKCLLVMDPGLTAALAAGLAQYVAYLVPLSSFGTKAVAILAILALAAVNVGGVARASAAVRVITALKLGLLGGLVVWGFLSGRGDWGHFVPFWGAQPGSGALAGVVVAAFFSFGGFWDVTKVAGEVKDPARTLPRALALGLALVTAVYVLTSAVFLYLVRPGEAATASAFAAQAGEALFGRAGAWLFAVTVIVCVLGSLGAFLMAAPRVYYAMARDGLFFQGVAQIHARFGTPARAILLQAVLASVLVAWGTFGEILAYFLFATLLFIALTVAAVLVLPRPVPGAYRMPAYPVPAVAFLALVAVLELLFVAGRPLASALGLLVVTLGIPVYRLLVAPRRSRTVPSPTVNAEEDR